MILRFRLLPGIAAVIVLLLSSASVHSENFDAPRITNRGPARAYLTTSRDIVPTATLRQGTISTGMPAEGAGAWFMVENRGQVTDMDGRPRPDVRYVLRAGDMRVFLRSAGVSFVQTIRPDGAAGERDDGQRKGNARSEDKDEPVTIERVDLDFLNANSSPRVRGELPLDWYANMYTAGNPDGALFLPVYRRAVYENVWPGIDFVLRIDDGGLKYEFVVRPGGLVRSIALRYSENAVPVLRADGGLDVRTRTGLLKEDAPRCFADGRSGRSDIDGRFVVSGRTVRFSLSGAPEGADIVIDPSLSWSTYVGSNSIDFSGGVDVDQNGDVWMCGSTSGTNFPTTSGVFQTTMSAAAYDGYIIKFSAAGSQIWGTYYAGAVVAMGIRCDASGNAFLTGCTPYANFPVSAGAFQTTKSSSHDAILIKMLSNGTRGWATFYGGSGSEVGMGLMLDGGSRLYFTGQTSSSNFPVSAGAFQTTIGGSTDAFLVKFDTSGTRIWGSYIGGSGTDFGHGCSPDGSSNILVAGEAGSGFPVTAGTLQSTFPGGPWSGFLLKFDSSGARLWGTYFGSTTTGYDVGHIGGEPVLVGYTTGTIPISNAFQGSRAGGEDGFLARLNATGTALVWSTYFGGNNNDHITSLRINSNGNPYVTGCTFSTNFPVTSGAFQTTYGGGEDRFIAIFNSSGQRCWATYMGGSSVDVCWSSPPVGERAEHDIALTPSGDFYAAGNTYGNFPTTGGAFQTTAQGQIDAFLMKFLNDCGGTVNANAGSDTSICRGTYANIGGTAGGSPCGAPYTYAWTPPTGLDSTNIARPKASPTSTTTYVVTVTDANNCTDTDTMTVTVTGLGAAITPDTSFVCRGGSATLTATTGSGFLYAWYKDGALINGANSSALAGAQPGSYRVLITTAAGCYDTSAVAYVLTSPDPGATITPAGPTTFCSGGSVLLNANTGPGLQYTWQRDGSTIPGATGSSYTASISGGYRVIVTNQYGCTDTSASITVTVIPGPGASITAAGPTTFCAGGSVVLNANTGTGLVYQWLRNNAPISGANAASYTATLSGGYRVVVTNPAGCSDTSFQITVTVHPRPGATVTPGGPLTFCAGGSVTLYANTGPGFTYAWQRNNSTISGATDSIYTAVQSGSYRVIVTSANGCADTSASVPVIVNARPGAAITAAGPTSFCIPDSVLLTATSGSGLTYVWLRDGAPISGALSSTYTARQSGGYRVIVTNSAGCSDTSTVVTVTAEPRPGATISGGPPVICEGGQAILSANTGSGYTYSWLRDGGIIGGASGPTYTATQSGSYRVIVTTGAGCSDTSSAFMLTVHPKPTASISALGPTTFCEPDSVTLRAAAVSGVTYKWLQDGMAIPGATSPNLRVGQSGSFRVILTTANGCVDTSAAIDVTVHQRAGAAVVPQGPVSFCEGEEIALTATLGGGLTYEWQRNGTAIGGATGPTYAATMDGRYRVIIRTADGCIDTSNAVAVTVNPLPDQRIEGKTSVCPNTVATYFVAKSAGYSFEWIILSGSLLSGQSTSKIDVRWGQPGAGEVRVRITNAATGCARDTILQVSISLTLHPVIISSGPGVLCEGDSVQLDAGAGYLSYNWEYNGASMGLNTRIITVSAPGVYLVSVTDSGGCSGTSAPFVLSVDLRPNVQLTASGPTLFCAGDRVTLSANSVPAGAFTWLRDGTVILGATGGTYVATQPGRYRVSVTTPAGCRGDSDSLEVIVRPVPAAFASADGKTDLCEGDSARLIGQPAAGVSYQWLRDGTPLAGATDDTLIVRQAGNYRVIVADLAAGCKDTSLAIAVTVRPMPIARIAGATEICRGESTILSADGATGTILWSTGSTARQISVTETGRYELTVTDSSGCTATASVTVTVHPVPILAVQGSRTMCRGGQTTLDAQAGFAGYLWSTGVNTRRITVFAPGVYWVAVTDSNGCTARDTVTVIESDRLTPTISGRTALCPGGTTTLEADSNETYIRYLWTTETDSTSYLGIERRFTASVPGRYMVRVVDRGGCSGSAIVEIVQASATPFISGRLLVCEGRPPDTLDAGAGYVAYLWNTGARTRTLEVRLPGTYTVDVTDTNGCTWTVSVQVRERRIEPLIAGSKTFCTGSGARLSAVWPGATGYVWSTGDRTRDVTIRIAGAVWVRVTDSSGCEGTAIDTLRESSTLTPAVAGPREFCAGRSTILDAGSGLLWYLWSDLDTTRILSRASSIEVRAAGRYILRVADSSGCQGLDTVRVSEYPPMNARIDGDTVFCPGGSASLYATPGLVSYEWSTGETTNTISVNKPGAYRVRVTDAFGCEDTLRVDVREQTELAISIAGRTGFCRGDTDTLDAGAGYAQYTWTTTDTGVVLGISRRLIVTQAGTYLVRVATTSGCIGRGSMDVLEFAPPDPRIAQSGDTLETTPFAAHQWMLDGTDIPGADGQRIVATIPGRYTVRVTDANGCTGISPPVDIARGAGTARIALGCPPGREYPVGTVVLLPLQLEALTNAPQGSASTFTAVVSTDPSILFPRFTAVSGTAAGRRLTMRVPGRRDPSLTAGTLLELPFEVLWSDTACARVRIDSVLWDDGTITDLGGTECEVCAALCYQGGARLFRADGQVSLQIRPNPFNASTLIEFEVIETGLTEIAVYDRMGRRVASLLHEDVVPGRYLLRFDASALASGMYICVLLTPTELRTRVMEVLK